DDVVLPRRAGRGVLEHHVSLVSEVLGVGEGIHGIPLVDLRHEREVVRERHLLGQKFVILKVPNLAIGLLLHGRLLQFRGCCGAAAIRSRGAIGRSTRGGNSSYVWPSSVRPAAFLFLPPHCLKKKGTPCSRHRSRMDRTQACSIGLAPGPLSP